MITHEERKMLYESLPSNASPLSLADGAISTPPLYVNATTTHQHSLSPSWFSPSVHDIGSFVQKHRKKNWLLMKLLLL